MKGLNLKCCGVCILIVAVLVPLVAVYLDRNVDRWKGFVPIFHLGVPHGFSVEDIPDLTGKTYLVTGANSGLGFWTTKYLAQHNATVYMASRNLKKLNLAKDDILSEIPTASMKIVQLDLNDLKSVEIAGNSLVGVNFDGLILNAGVAFNGGPDYSAQGYESHFAINHLGHFYLTELLLPSFDKEKDATITVLTSMAHTALENREDFPITIEDYNSKEP
eukprot:UN23962